MCKRYSVILIIFVLLAWSIAACNSNTKIVKRFAGGTSTLTPFALKATYTSTNTPVKNTGEELDTNLTLTAPINQTDSEKTSEVVITGEPSYTTLFTLTPEINSPTVSATVSTAAPSAITKPADPSDTAKPSATTEPIEPSHTQDHPADTNTPVPPAATYIPVPPAATYTPVPPTATYTPKPPTMTSAPPATQTPDGCTFSGNTNFENQVVALINQERTDRGLPDLGNNSSLQLAARRHSEDMACNDFFSHTGSDGSTLSSRLLAAGYSYSWAAENIAASSSSNFSAQAVVSMWMNSPGHKANILSENVTQIGVGFRYAGDSAAQDFDAYYTADFGRPR